MKKLNWLLALTAASFLLAACSQGQSAPPVVNSVNPGNPNYSHLEFSVGTANLGESATAINLVSTLRQPNGDSAVLVDTPSITGAWTGALPAAVPDGGDGFDPYSTIQDGGPSLTDFNSNALTGTAQTVHLGTPPCDSTGNVPGFTTCPAGVPANATTFGQAGGVFGMGLQPSNSTTNSTPYSYVPYPQPMFGSTGPTGFEPFGGPPAFDDTNNGMGTRDGLHNLGSGLLGWNTGMNIVQLTAAPGSGAYSMSVSVPTGQDQTGKSGFATFTANATLNAGIVLPVMLTPALAEDGAGGGSLAVLLPAGATEGYVTIVDFGAGPNGGANCQGALGPGTGFPVYYTLKFSRLGLGHAARQDRAEYHAKRSERAYAEHVVVHGCGEPSSEQRSDGARGLVFNPSLWNGLPALRGVVSGKPFTSTGIEGPHRSIGHHGIATVRSCCVFDAQEVPDVAAAATGIACTHCPAAGASPPVKSAFEMAAEGGGKPLPFAFRNLA